MPVQCRCISDYIANTGPMPVLKGQMATNAGPNAGSSRWSPRYIYGTLETQKGRFFFTQALKDRREQQRQSRRTSRESQIEHKFTLEETMTLCFYALNLFSFNFLCYYFSIMN